MVHQSSRSGNTLLSRFASALASATVLSFAILLVASAPARAQHVAFLVDTTLVTAYVSDQGGTTKAVNITIVSDDSSVSTTVRLHTFHSTHMFLGDSSITFRGRGSVWVLFAPGPGSPSPDFSTLTATSDSNTASTVIEGFALRDSIPLGIAGDDFVRVARGGEQCNLYTITNTNQFGITITGIFAPPIYDNGTGFHAYGPALPYKLAPSASTSFQVCASIGQNDSTGNVLAGDLTVHYVADSFSVQYTKVHPMLATPQTRDNECMSVPRVVFVDTIAAGDSADRSFTIENHSNTSIAIDTARFIGDSLGLGEVLSSLPITIDGNSSATMHVRFRMPRNALNTLYAASLWLTASGTSNDTLPCRGAYVELQATLKTPTADTIEIDLPSGDTTSESLTVHTALSHHALYLHNTGTSSVIVTYLGTTSDLAWLVEPYQRSLSPYDSLGPNEGRTYLLGLEVGDTGTYNIDLVVNFTNALTSRHYHVIVHRMNAPLASAPIVTSAIAPAGLTIHPNPATTAVTIQIENNEQGTLEIFDAIGHSIWKHAVVSSIVWNGVDAAGEDVAAGTYIARLTHTDAEGHTTVTSRRIVLLR